MNAVPVVGGADEGADIIGSPIGQGEHGSRIGPVAVPPPRLEVERHAGEGAERFPGKIARIRRNPPDADQTLIDKGLAAEGDAGRPGCRRDVGPGELERLGTGGRGEGRKGRNGKKTAEFGHDYP